ncbi:MAG: VWA domain-containing protein [bacterium]|nr:VWA domain-containing protein [bacterium]
MRFESPLFLLLLPLIFAVFILRSNKNLISTVKYTNLADLYQLEDRTAMFFSGLSKIIRYAVLIIIIIALARPQGVNKTQNKLVEGIDIMLVLDVSESMAAEDFQSADRLSVAKKTIKEFIKKRDSDRMGLVVFGGAAFTQCPLTLDSGVLIRFLDHAKINMAEQGTAIGMAIATALNRIKESTSKSRILILLTDGENNRGAIEPLKAAELARNLGVKVYTIGVGKEGIVPLQDPVRGKILVRTSIDEETLKNIAAKTNGQYFRAEDEQTLKSIYSSIDKLEKTKIKTKANFKYKDYFPFLLWIIFILLLVEFIISNVVFISVP